MLRRNREFSLINGCHTDEHVLESVPSKVVQLQKQLIGHGSKLQPSQERLLRLALHLTVQKMSQNVE